MSSRSESRSEERSSPLGAACEAGDLAAVRELLVTGHSPLDEHCGQPVFLLVLEMEETNVTVAILRQLARACVLPNPDDENDMTLLHVVAGWNKPRFLAVLLEREEFARRLFALTAEGETLLHRAGGAATANLLLERGLVIDQRDAFGYTPLATAVLRHNAELLEFLLEAGADPTLADARGRTPLHLAALEGNPAAVRRLLATGANPRATDRSGRTPLQLAQAPPREMRRREHTAAAEELSRAIAQ